MYQNSINFSLYQNDYSQNIFKQIEMFKNFEEEVKNKTRKAIQEHYEQLDSRLRQKYSNNNKGYILYSKRPATLITEWGPVTYERTRIRYYDRKLYKHKYVFLLDIEIDRKSYQCLHFDLYIKILKELDSCKRYRDILDKYKYSEISLMTISNINRSINLQEYNTFCSKIMNLKLEEIIFSEILEQKAKMTLLNFMSLIKVALPILRSKLRVSSEQFEVF
ncbi:UPF0236 family transposase-like protein [Spiroplasma chrysopicola]|uniref:Uncharacterized protein n=1 Tax=Spiroplasma chrysopicola DF-1 TaxID=1276227 RepID=R4UAT5_9MOLU|nr:UPF0236 family protein [Spiroplasma chrysopicola]AGM25019.1 hypothetical protein SCHRY_v1c04380 [Spiroplasma chrysopicola DF-1]